MTALARLPDSARFGLRFLCAAWLAGSAAVLRLFATAAPAAGNGSAGPAVLLLLALCAAFGVGLLWRTRGSGIRELVESSAAFGFWTGIFALMV
ncbi:MAG TPA: hypothetical protein VIZ58_04585 [Thermoanaerobaculia bacterium]